MKQLCRTGLLTFAVSTAVVTGALYFYHRQFYRPPMPVPEPVPKFRVEPGRLPASPNSFPEVIEKSMPSVVLVTAQRRVGVVSFDAWGDPRKLNYLDVPSGQGSGFFIREDGYILTNYHVVREQDSFWITMHDGEELPAKVVGADPPSDLALLKVETSGKRRFPALRFAEPQNIRVGQWAIAIGAPFSLNRTVTVGIVSNKQRSGVGMNMHENYIQTDASINPGNSGGPLLDLAGNVLGVNDFILSPSGGNIGLSFAISAEIAREIAETLIRDGHVQRPWLGVATRPLERQEKDQLGANGVAVLQVFRNSPAAGVLRRGDLILTIDGEKTLRSEELQKVVFASSPGQQRKLEIFRDGKKQTVTVRLVAAPQEYYRKFRDAEAARTSLL